MNLIVYGSGAEIFSLDNVMSFLERRATMGTVDF